MFLKLNKMHCKWIAILLFILLCTTTCIDVHAMDSKDSTGEDVAETDVLNDTDNDATETNVLNHADKDTGVLVDDEKDIKNETDKRKEKKNFEKEYTQTNIDNSFCEFKKYQPYDILYVKQTFVDLRKLPKKELKFKTLWKEEEGEYSDAFLKQNSDNILLYNTDDDSKYLVGYANKLQNKNDVITGEYCFAKLNNNGETLKSCYYDYDTGLVYVPKKVSNLKLGNVQVQFLEGINGTTLKNSIQVDLLEEDFNGNLVKSKTVESSYIDDNIVVTLSKNKDIIKMVHKDDIQISFNNIGKPIEDFVYDDGVIKIPLSSSILTSIQITIHIPSFFENIKNKLFDTILSLVTPLSTKANDVMPTKIKLKGRPENYIGQTFECNGTMNYSTGGNLPDTNTYCYSNNNASNVGTCALWNCIINGAAADYTNDLRRDYAKHYLVWGGTVSYDTTNIKMPDTYISLQCAHIQEAGIVGTQNKTGNSNTSASGKVNMKILGFTSDNLLAVGFATQSWMGGQAGAGVCYFELEPLTGFLKLNKSSSNSKLSKNNKCYSLNGAKYNVYKNYSCTEKVGEFVTDANGNSTNTLELDEDIYYVKEVQSPKGYSIWNPSNPYSIKVEAEKTHTINVQDAPQENPVDNVLNKVDKETHAPYPLEKATLKGAKYIYKYYDNYSCEGTPKATWTFITDENGQIKFKKSYLDDTATNSEFYYSSDNSIVLPIGSIEAQEIQAPTGYLIDTKIYKCKIESVNNNIAVNSNGKITSKLNVDVAFVSEEQCIRGDYKFTKISEITNEAIPYCPFKITSVATGEETYIFTDENGQWSSESDYILHEDNTNSGEKESGIWFGKDVMGNASNADDKLGAFPYGTYIFQELPFEDNEELKLLTWKVEIKKNGFVVDGGTKIDKKKTTQDIQSEKTNNPEGTKSGTEPSIEASDKPLIDHVQDTHPEIQTTTNVMSTSRKISKTEDYPKVVLTTGDDNFKNIALMIAMSVISFCGIVISKKY